MKIDKYKKDYNERPHTERLTNRGVNRREAISRETQNPQRPEMEKRADTADISVLFLFNMC